MKSDVNEVLPEYQVQRSGNAENTEGESVEYGIGFRFACLMVNCIVMVSAFSFK